MKTEIIAEIGSNWKVGGDDKIDRALELIGEASLYGATAVKFQLFRGNKLWRPQNKQDAIAPYELPLDWLPLLHDCAKYHNLEFLCTPFYPEAVNELKPFVKRWKIASGDLTYTPLLEKVGKTGMPVLLSCGYATTEEIETAIETLSPGTELPEHITLLHCTGSYPTPPEEMILNRIVELGAEFFPLRVGFSSHSTNPALTASSVLFGATVIEVHFDLDDKKGVETGHSYTPQKLQELVHLAKLFEMAKDCDCEFTLGDTIARTQSRRDPSDWLRPVKE